MYSHRTSPKIPQEIIDAIIDELDASSTDGIEPKTLKSCALVARAFVRPSQMKLFATVNLHSYYHERSRLFSRLISSRPHIGHYVKNLNLAYRSGRSASLGQILSSLPKLKTISLYPQQADPFPTYHRDSFLAAFSLSSLRRLALRDHIFPDALELQSLLINSTGLEELVLIDIQFTNTSASEPETRPESRRIVLRSLEFVGMPIDYMEAVLSSFSIVDIIHLRSLSCDRFHKPLFLANAHSMEKLELVVNHRPGEGHSRRARLHTSQVPLV